MQLKIMRAVGNNEHIDKFTVPVPGVRIGILGKNSLIEMFPLILNKEVNCIFNFSFPGIYGIIWILVEVLSISLLFITNLTWYVTKATYFWMTRSVLKSVLIDPKIICVFPTSIQHRNILLPLNDKILSFVVIVCYNIYGYRKIEKECEKLQKNFYQIDAIVMTLSFIKTAYWKKFCW